MYYLYIELGLLYKRELLKNLDEQGVNIEHLKENLHVIDFVENPAIATLINKNKKVFAACPPIYIYIYIYIYSWRKA